MLLYVPFLSDEETGLEREAWGLVVRWWPSPPWSPVLSTRAAAGGRGLQYIPRTPYLVDVIHALHLELSQPWHIQLPAAIWAQSDLQLLLRLFPKQVPGVAIETLLLPSPSGLCLPHTQSLAWNLLLHPSWTTELRAPPAHPVSPLNSEKG